MFLLPALALYCVFVLIPIAQAAHFSLYKWNGLQPLTDFVGLKNYQTALASDTFRIAVANNLLIVGLSLAIQIPFALGLAVLLNRRFPGRAIFRGDSTIVMITLFVIISWKYFGFHMILLLAGLQGIPHEIEEAALIDGADRRQAFRHVTLPLLGPTLRVSVFLSIIGALQLFDMVWVMTAGGPLNASSTMAIAMFKAGFKNSQMGFGSALAVILFVFGLVVALAYQRFVLRRDVEGAVTVYNG